MITDPLHFFGRVGELNSIFSRLEPAQPQSVLVVGENRVGCSSLLEHIRPTYAAQLHKPQRFRVGYLAAQGARSSTEGFRARVLAVLGAPHAEAVTEMAFEATLRQLREGGTQPILLLDEIESLTAHG